MYTKNVELLNTQTSVEEISISKETYSLIERKSIANTPFTEQIDNEHQNKSITIGKYRLNKEPLDLKINSSDWLKEHIFEIILSVAIVVNEISQSQSNKII